LFRRARTYIVQLFNCDWTDHTKSTPDTFRLRHGDVVELMDELQENALKDDWMYGRCERTGLCGGFPYDSIYILPTCEKPPPEFMVRYTCTLRSGEGGGQWWKQDQNVKTKTNLTTARPQLDLTWLDITKKTLLLQHACLLSKNNFVQKPSKVIWWPVTFVTVSALIARKNRCLLHFSMIMSHSACRAQQCWK